MTELGPAQAAPSKEELLKALGAPLKAMVAIDVRGDVDPEKAYQYRMARRYELYDRGHQYLAPYDNENGVSDYTSLGNVKYDKAKSGGRRYDSVINILRGDKRKFVAVLGQRAPVIKCMPDRDDDEDAIRLSRRADLEARKLFFKWEVQRQQRSLAEALWKTSTTFGFVDFVTDAEKYGTIQEPQYELQGDSANGQLPVPTGTKSYPKGDVEFALATIFEVTTPFYGRNVKGLPWLLYEFDEHNGKLLQMYGKDNPQLREKLLSRDGGSGASGAGGASAIGTQARETIASPSNIQLNQRRNRSLYSRIWITPTMYELVKESGQRDMLTQNFPTGAKLTLIADELVDIEESVLSEHWTYCKPDTSPYIFADPICADFIGIQDFINDLHNIEMETRERAIPWSLFDPQVLDPAVMRKQAQLPGEMVPCKPGAGQQLSASIWKAPTATVPEGNDGCSARLIQMGRENTGILPAIFGGDGKTQTALEANQKRDQAMMQLGVTWAEMRSFWERAIEMGIRLKAKYGAAQGGDDEGAPEEQLAMLSELETGKWHCEADEQMPLTWGQRRDMYMELVKLNPQAVSSVFGLNTPNNLPQVQQIFGMDGWEIPKLNDRDKVYEEITQLLQGQPTHNPQTGKVEPSVPIDVYEDDHQLCSDVVKEWCQSQRGRIAKSTTPGGYSNVIAWGMAHLDMTMPDPAQAPPAGGHGAAPPQKPQPDGPSPMGGGTQGQPGGPLPTPQTAEPPAQAA